MSKNRHFNQSNNFFATIGRPAFKILLLAIFSLSVISIFVIRLTGKIVKTPLKFPSLKKTRLHLSSPKLSFPKIVTPRFSIPKIPIPKITFPQLRYPKILFPRLLYRLILLSAGIGCISFFIYIEIFKNLPDAKSLSIYPSKITTQILDRSGNLLYKIYKDENRTLISLDILPQHVKNAFLAAEDKNFYQHRGFSITGLSRAVYRNLFDDKMEGGSTITQQLVKNTLLTNEKTLSRKIKELVLSLKVEHYFSKDKIFEMYLNQVGFGGPAYGIQEAARQYFNVDAKDLNLSQSAYLAGLTRAPSKYSPFGEHPDLAISRQKTVLNQMYSDGFINQTELAQALSEKLTFSSAKIEIKAPHFVMMVKDLLTEQLGEKTVTQGGLKVITTLDLNLQEKAQKIVTEEISKLKPYNVSNGAALITNPKTGEILAMVGSKDYFNLNEDGQVNLTLSLRQPGSSIKPLNYALSFENGYSPASVIEDKPISFNLPGQQPWTPKNYDNRFHGSITLRQALGSSYNIPSVILLSKNGINAFASLAKKMGITTWDDPRRYGLSMALGSLEVKMVDLAAAYSAFANQGVSSPLNSIIRIEKNNGENLYASGCPSHVDIQDTDTQVNAEETSCTQKQAISSETAYLITDILSDNNARSPAFGGNSVLNIKTAKVAVKTGTSNDLKDNWTIGFTKDFLVATWVGNNNNEPMSQIASGITGASPIWAKIFNNIIAENPQPKEITPPTDMVKVPVCILTGTLTCSGCPTRYEYFSKDKIPTTTCKSEDIVKLLNPAPSPLSSNTPQIL